MGALEQQRQLQREAAAVLADLDVLPRLREFGHPVQVGSVALGLMVARDIDLTVLCPALDTSAIFGAAAALASHPRVRELLLRDDTGSWNIDPDYPDGILWRPRYRSVAGDEWTLDIWFIHEDSQQFDLVHLESLPPRLTTRSGSRSCASRRRASGVRGTAATASTSQFSITACARRRGSAPTWRVANRG